MKRRELLKSLAVIPFVAPSALSQRKYKRPSERKFIKPRRLKKGDTISLIAPASGLSEEIFNFALQNIADLGFRTKIGNDLIGNYWSARII